MSYFVIIFHINRSIRSVLHGNKATKNAREYYTGDIGRRTYRNWM